jgi:thymidylate synthase
MAFENREVLRIVLGALEPNKEVRSSSMELAGLPLDFILAANPNIDYIKIILEHMREQQSSATNLLVGGHPVNNKPVLKPIKWFINFGTNLGAIVTHNDNFLLDWEEEENGYLVSRAGMSTYILGSLIFNVSRRLDSRHTTLHEELTSSMVYHEHHYRKVLNFLASGISIKADASKEEVDTWKKVFRLFLVGRSGNRYRFELLAVR